MILGKHAIERAFRTGTWKAYTSDLGAEYQDMPVRNLHIGPNSIDVTLAPKFLVPKPVDQLLYLDRKPPFDLYEEKFGSFWVLEPKGFILGCVQERFDCSAPLKECRPVLGTSFEAVIASRCFAPMIEGRSTLARLGISIHSCAGFGDYGFKGAFTLEIKNDGPFTVVLQAGMRIAQVYFMEVLEPGEYEGAYAGNDHNDKPIAPVLGAGRF